MNKNYRDKLNILAGLFCLFAGIISIFTIIPVLLIYGVYTSEPTTSLYFGIGSVALFFCGSYYVFKSVSEKNIIYTKKDKKVPIRALILIASMINLIIFVVVAIRVINYTGNNNIFYPDTIAWIIGIVMTFIAGCIYSEYKYEVKISSSNPHSEEEIKQVLDKSSPTINIENELENRIYNYLKENQSKAFTVKSLKKRLENFTNGSKDLNYSIENLQRVLSRMRTMGYIHSEYHAEETYYFVP